MALDSLNGITQFKTGSTIANGMKLSEVAVNKYKASIEGLSLSQAQVALSTTALNDAQKEQILISAGLITSTESVTAADVKQAVAENVLTTAKQQEVLATFEAEMAEGKMSLERLQAIALENTEAGSIAKVILAKKEENVQNLKNIASGKALTTVLKEQLLALATNPMTWVVAGLAGVVTVAYQCSQAIEEVETKAQELNETFSTSKTEIDDYKTQIDDLYKVINDSGSSIEDVTTARQNLMTIQDQLIEKFGDEKDTIDLVTDAINGQTDALNTLTEAQWQDAKNEFNESGFWNDVANGIDGYSNNIDRMLGEYEGYSVTIDMSEYGGTLFTEGYDEFKQMLMDDFGATISKSSTAALELSGSASEVRQKLLDIQEILKENSTYKPDDTFNDYLGGLERSANDVIEKYEDFYKQYILYEEIFTNDTFTDSYKKINEAYSEYKDAFATGDEKSIKKAQDNFANILTQATEGVSDESVVDFFNDMYPDLQEVVGNWQFETNFTANTDGLKDDVSGYLSGLDGLYSYDLKNFSYDTATEEQKESYDGLISVARLYGLTIDQLIDKLALMGLVQDENYKKLVDLFGQEAVDKLTPEDLEIAYSISSEEADKALEQEKNKIKSELESLSKEGNVDLTIRPVIDSSAMQAAGWDVEDGSIATTFTQGEFIWQGDEENGQYVYVHYTPILPDGTVLTPDELTDYLYGTLEGSQNVLDSDNKGIVLKVDTDLNIPEGDIKKFTNGEGSTDAIDGLIQKTGEWDDKVHSVQEQYYDTGEGIGYASNALDGLIEKHKQIENPDKTDNLSFTDLLNSSDYKDIKEKLLDVAKSGEITEETLSSTEEYNKLLEETGTSADSAKNQILDMLSAQEKLSAATQGLNKLKSAYEEFKDEDIGFVTAQTLESLPDSFKKLGGFDSFSQIVGDPTSGTEAIQQAFNDIVKQYLISQDTLSQLVNASKHEIQSYIANLKQMGINNADEIVNQTINVLSQENELINEASDEYYKAYVKYLDSKDKADLSYVESVASKSSQLSNALGQPYQTDYNNWCELLKKKAEAYNDFITKLGASFDKISIPNAPYSEEGLNQKKAEAIINNAKGKKVLSWDELNNASTKNTIEMMRNLGNVSDYSKEQVESAEKYLEALKIATEYKNTLKLDLSAIDTNFTSSFSPDVSSDKDTKDSKESFDFIEIAISRLTDALDKLKTKADDVYSTWGTRNASLADAINKTKTAIQLQSQAYSAYMQEANSVGLPSYYKTLVQNGAIKISDISDETLKDQISEYQNWYEKAQDCLKTQNDLNDELNELKSQKFDDLKTQYDDIIGRMEASKDLLESQITLLSSSGDYNSLRGQQRAIVNGLKEELASLTKEFNSSGVLYGTEKWYDLQSQIDDVKQQIVDAEATLKDIDNLQFDNIKEAFDFDTSQLEHGIQMIQNKIDILEMKGQFANESYYNGMIQYTQKELDTLIKERSQLQNILNNTLYKQGTSEWNDMYSTLMDIDEEIDSMTSNLTEFNNAIRDLNWDIFEYLEESINRITDETSYLIDLVSKADLFDENGQITKYGTATIALHATAYDTYKQQAQDYYEEVQDLQRQLVNGAGKDVLEQYNEMVEAHRDAVLAAEDEKQAILDLIDDTYQKQIDYLNEIISKKKESLNAEKDLYDYQKSIEEKSKNISSLQKQYDAYKNDMSEEGISQAQKIKVSLEEAKADLKETEYDKYLQDSQDMLDKLSEDYEEWMNNRLDNEDALLSEIIGTVSGKGDEINSTLNEVADKYGTMISDSITSIFDAKSPFTNTLSDGINTINNSIAGTTSAIDRLIAQVANITNANASKTNAGNGTKGNNTNTSGNSNKGNNTNTSGNIGNNNSNNSTSQNSSNNSVWGSWFIKKTDSYPKNKLDIQNSILDRLKYNSIDPSFSARSKYYSAMGGSGIYTGSSSQNTWMLSQLKSHGYAKGSKYIPYDQIALLGEKGNELQFDKSEGVLREVGEGDKIFTNEASKVLWDLSKDPSAFLEKFGLANITPQFNVVTPTLPKMERNNVSNSVNMSVDGVEINLPNVTNYKEFRNELIKDSTFTNAMGTYVNNKIMGKNPLEHLKYVNH